MNKHSLPPLNNKRSKSTVFIPLIVIIISFHLILLYIYINRKSDKVQGSDRAVTLTKVENEGYSDTPVQNQLIVKDEPIELELAENSDNTDDNENTEDSSLPALMSKNDTQIEGNPEYQTLFPTYNEAMTAQQEQNIAPTIPNENQPLENISADNKQISPQEQEKISKQEMEITNKKQTKAKTTKKRRRSKSQPMFNEPYIDEPMYPPTYREPEPQATEQDLKDSALLSSDLPQVQRPLLVPINKKAKEKLQQMEQAKAKNDKLQEQLSSSIQNVRVLNARKIEQEKQLARRAYEDSLALQELKNQTRHDKKKQAPKAEVKKPVKAKPKKVAKVTTKTAQQVKTEPKKSPKVATKATAKVEAKKVAKTQPKQAPKAKVEAKKVQKSEPKKIVQPQKKAPPKATTPKVKESKKTVEPKKQDKKEQP